MKKLRIAEIAPLFERVPPKRYGGTERVVSTLTEELVERGHEVTLFASGDSITSANLVSVYPRSLRETRMDYHNLNDLILLNIGNAYRMQDRFDIIHDHNGIFGLPAADNSITPVVMTLHGPFTMTNRRAYGTLNRPSLVAISRAQAAFAPKSARLAGIVYNGLKMDSYPFSANPENYLLVVGRISMEKGTHIAIEVAQELDIPLIIAAKLDNVDLNYFETYIRPKLTGNVRWIGEVDEKRRNELMKNALCFLHPVTWHEPFGLTLIEAMACGCPIVAFGKGSIPEVVADGVTGFVASDLYEMIEMVRAIDQISRIKCRQYALENFNEKRMADGYERVYAEVLKKGIFNSFSKVDSEIELGHSLGKA